jgi:N-acetylglucosamine-6-phosphate deacetylase
MKAVDSPTLLLEGARIVLPGDVAEGKSLLIEGGRIARIGGEGSQVGRTFDLSKLTIFPGFVDIHIHGAVGVDVTEASGDLHQVATFLARNGVTSWLPTLVPAADEDYARATQAIERLMLEQDALTAAARAVGVHYEGPFVNEQQCGALRKRFFRTFKSPSDLDVLARVNAEDAVHMITLAPEIEGGIELVEELSARGWVISIGHPRADVEALDRARSKGARHMTHFLNAMLPLHHRAPGPVGWGLLRDDVTVDVIADGIHCDPLMLELVLRCKTPERVSLISDAVAPAGLGDGEYRVWEEKIKVVGGRTSNERGSIAGSVITMGDAIRMMAKLGLAETDIARVASYNPARLLAIDGDCGSIDEGKRADLVALDAEGRVHLTLVAGRVAFEA